MADQAANYKIADGKTEKLAGSKIEDLSLRTSGSNPERLIKWFESIETWCDTELETPGISKVIRGGPNVAQSPELTPPVPPEPKNKLVYQRYLQLVGDKEREFELYEQARNQYEIALAEYNEDFAAYQGGLEAAGDDEELLAEIGDAPQAPNEPQIPDFGNIVRVEPVFNTFEVEAYKRDCDNFEKKIRQKNKDLIKLYGKMKTCMAADSMGKIREQPEFPTLEQQKDPVKLAQLIVQTHIGSSHLNDPEEIADSVFWSFQRIKQAEKESLSSYRDRFNAMDDSLNIALEKVGDETFRISESRKIRMFVRGLHASWSQFKTNFKRKQLDIMPTSINGIGTGVYAIAQNFGTDQATKLQVTDGNSKLAFQSTARVSQIKKCNHCEQDGHIDKDCFYKNKSKADAIAKAKAYREKQAKKLQDGAGGKAKPN